MLPGRLSSLNGALLAIALLGCGHEAAPGPASMELPRTPATPPPEPTAEPKLPAPAVASGSVVAPPLPLPRRFALVEFAPTQGNLAPLLQDAAVRAKEKGLRPLVEFYADWCAPCRVFRDNLAGPELSAALDGTYLVRLNLDDWHDKLQGTGLTVVKTIPSFYLLGEQGKLNGKMLDGDKWGKSTPERMSAALRAFLGG